MASADHQDRNGTVFLVKGLLMFIALVAACSLRQLIHAAIELRTHAFGLTYPSSLQAMTTLIGDQTLQRLSCLHWAQAPAALPWQYKGHLFF